MLKQKVRFKLLDLILIIFCIGIVYFIFYRINVQLEYRSNWAAIPRYLLRKDPSTGKLIPNYLLLGLFTTIRLSVWSTLLGLVVGVIMGIFRTTKILFLRLVGRIYVEFIRNLPPLVLIFLFYYFASGQILPLLGVEEFIRTRSASAQAILAFFFAEKALFTQFVSGVITIGLFEGAFITEVVRSGIESIERGQREAAYSLGLSWLDQMRFIIMPQAIKRILPPLGNEFISTVKRSSIVSAISIQELTFQGRQLATSTLWVFEVWITVALMYLMLTLILSFAVSAMEKRLRISD
ncbi:MAG: amino acid ABC transporter permease [Spirochaetes bacterium]|nr:MAG: amino acid ABC transporter permease [Spirochaetota bacterium]